MCFHVDSIMRSTGFDYLHFLLHRTFRKSSLLKHVHGVCSFGPLCSTTNAMLAPGDSALRGPHFPLPESWRLCSAGPEEPSGRSPGLTGFLVWRGQNHGECTLKVGPPTDANCWGFKIKDFLLTSCRSSRKAWPSLHGPPFLPAGPALLTSVCQQDLLAVKDEKRSKINTINWLKFT